MPRCRALILSLVITASVGGCGSDDDKARRELADARQQIERERDAARDEIEQQRAAAAEDLDEVREDVSAERQRLRREKRKVSAERRRLAQLRSEVSGVRETIARNTVEGDGTYAVGEDIEPGTYRSEGQDGCYWARLSSFDTSDILDNDNADGPVVIEVLPSDKALQLSGCAAFQKAN